ncbi:MAG: carbohydrate ABC transporter substrate-binding protein [Clostridia bacterium]|nr:carbohydrate ABC transporter substrate-binding protein [Clostridia bacterium]
MKSKTIKAISLLLVLMMLVSMIVSCGSKKPSGDPGKTDDTSSGNDKDGYLDDIGETDEFEGKTFNVLAREDNMYGNFAHEVIADEDEVELVNQSVYERNTAVEERFGVKLNVILKPGAWAQLDDFTNLFKTSIMAGDGAYDLIMSQQAYMAKMSLQDLYMNLYDLPYVDFEKDYWYKDIRDELTVDGKLFYGVGDYSLTYWENLYVLYFNKTLADNYNVENLYDLVKSGDWTLDKMIEIVKGKYKDLNGDNWPDVSDQFGYITCYGNTMDALFSQFDVQATHKDDNGDIVLDVDQSKMVSILEKMNAFIATDEVHIEETSSSTTEDEDPLDKMFQEDKALFYPEVIDKAHKFRGMETDFGIIPYPKWNELQKEYPTQAQNGYSVAVAPIDIPDKDLTGAMLEALTSESKRTVIPTYNEQALTYKYTRDDESAEMLNLVRENIRINFGYFYYVDLHTGEWFRILINKNFGNSNFVSFYTANKSGYERSLKKIIKSYIDHE